MASASKKRFPPYLKNNPASKVSIIADDARRNQLVQNPMVVRRSGKSSSSSNPIANVVGESLHSNSSAAVAADAGGSCAESGAGVGQDAGNDDHWAGGNDHGNDEQLGSGDGHQGSDDDEPEENPLF
jgi:hypothetical protein